MFSSLLKKYNFNEVTSVINSVSKDQVLAALSKPYVDIDDLPVLVSPAAGEFLEAMALRAAQITRERFGNTVLLYAPLYFSNECTNSCLYCGFSRINKDVVRKTLSLDEVEGELKILLGYGIKHVLLVCGEAPNRLNIGFICKIAELSKRYASFTGVEIYPLDVSGYQELINAGVDGLTVYQETYDAVKYAEVHPAGKKRDMDWRLDTADRGGLAGMRTIGVGALLGLSDPRTDAFFSILHASYLMKKYWKSYITISFPRMRPAEGTVFKPQNVPDKMFVQFILAARIILRDAGIVVSTRESPEMRDHLAGLGVTQMSAASATEPGGYAAAKESTAQFQVEDTRSVAEFSNMLVRKGYDPVTKDWDGIL